MTTQCVDPCIDDLVSRAHDIDRFLTLYLAELAHIAADNQEAEGTVRDELAELEALVRVVADLWESVSVRTARLYGELHDRGADAEVEHELAGHGQKWRRYLAFAAAAGIRVPAPLN